MNSKTSSPAPHIQQHTPLQSLALHLLPGVLIGAFYYAAVPFVRGWGYPTIFALNLAALFVLIPFEVGVLLYYKNRAGKEHAEPVIPYRQPLPWKQVLLWTAVIFLSSGLILTLLTPVSGYLQGFFSWIPERFQLGMGLDGSITRSKLILTTLSSFLLTVVAAPVVEEYYFRGFLLPRMPGKKTLGPLLHSFLFALYHTWTPWLVVSRTLALLPLSYIARWKKNILPAVIAHCLLNSIDIFIAAAFIAGLS